LSVLKLKLAGVLQWVPCGRVSRKLHRTMDIWN